MPQWHVGLLLCYVHRRSVMPDFLTKVVMITGYPMGDDQL